MKVSIFCYYDTAVTKHYRDMPIEDIPEWLKAYKFTHPCVEKISVMVDVKEWNVGPEEMPF